MKFQFDFDGNKGTDKKFILALKDFLEINLEHNLSSLFSKEFTAWILDRLEKKQFLDIMQIVTSEKANAQTAFMQIASSKKAASRYAKALESFRSLIRNNEAISKSMAERHKKELMIANESVANSSDEVVKLRKEVDILKAQLYDYKYPIVKKSNGFI